MSHTTIILNSSLLEIFDPAKPEYAGVRDHYDAATLAKIDALRARPSPSPYTFEERLFVCWVLDKAVMTADNP
jgi:hypothetical protein